MEFGRKLFSLRRERGLSQEGLAEVLGVSRQAVANWEAGDSLPEIPKLLMISKCFSVSLDRLVRDRSDENCHHHDLADETVGIDEFLVFLCRAKQSTYAAACAETSSSRPASHDLAYSEGRFRYIDTYLGGERFAGEEAVWIDASPIWAMNYVGRVINERFSGDFLKEALTKVTPAFPYRGPRLYVNGDFTYHCQVEGEPEWFEGREEIFCRNDKVYECRVQGGSIG